MSSVSRRDDSTSAFDVALPEMRGGEKLLWAAKPGAMGLARAEIGRALIGIPFLAFALYWTWSAGAKNWLAGQDNPAGFFPLFGLIFIVVGVGFVLSPLWAAIRARWIVYAVSDRRAVIITRFPTRRVQSFTPQYMEGLERIERGDGSGDLILRREYTSSRRRSSQLRRIGFFGIPTCAPSRT
jgi:hypothetical protein